MNRCKRAQTLTNAVLLIVGVVFFLMFIELKPISISGGLSHTCALIDGGAIECWGSNDYGKLGAGLPVAEIASTPVHVAGITDAKSLSVRTFHTCVVIKDGTINCWGRNNFGQLGNGTTEDSSIPVHVHGITNAVFVAVGVFHSCALLADGTVKCWGYNAYSQLGDRTFKNSHVPVLVKGLSEATAITSGGGHNCVVIRDRTIQCWGWNKHGQVGVGSDQETLSEPAQLLGIANTVEVSAGDYHTCAIVDTGEAFCWGLNGTPPSSEDLALRFYQEARASPDRPSTGATPTKLAAEINDRDLIKANAPVRVGGIHRAVRIYAGYARSCAILEDRSLTCWGRNSVGELGDGKTYPSASTPVAVTTVSNVLHFAISGSPCALNRSYEILCWGAGAQGGLGNGMLDASLDAVRVDQPNDRWLRAFGLK